MKNNTFNGFEQSLGNATFSNEQEKTRYDKLLSQQEVLRLRELISQDVLRINDISEIMNILVSTEIKLTNLNENDRYVLGKYLIWVNEYGKRYTKSLRAEELINKAYQLTERSQELRKEIKKEYAETFRALVHSYCYLARSPLSIEGQLIGRLTRDTQEITYKGLPTPTGQPNPQQFGK